MRYLWIITFSAVLIWSAIAPKDRFTWFLEVIPAVIGAALLAFTYRSQVGGRQLTRWMEQGRYAEVRAHWERVRQTTRLPPMRDAADYHIAACNLLEGRLDAALEQLETLGRARLRVLSMADGVSVYEAWILLAKGQAPGRARALLEAVIPPLDGQPEHLLLLAIALQRLGDKSAPDVYERALQAAGRRGPLGRWARGAPKQPERDAWSLSKGTYLFEAGHVDLAQPQLSEAADSPIPSVYRDLARARLAGLEVS